MTKILSQVVRTQSLLPKLGALNLLIFLCAVAMVKLTFATELASNQPLPNSSVSDGGIPLSPFQYIPSPRWKAPDVTITDNRSPAQKQLADLYSKAKYNDVAEQGMQLLTKEKVDDELQLAIANSLAWTGKVKEAGQLYRVLQPGKYGLEAMLGLANLHRWQGRDYLALPMYKEILAKEPQNKDALEGLRLANRETKPRTTIVLGGLQDSSKVEVKSLKINHRWADETLANIWEIETGTIQSKDPTISVTRPTVAVRYKALETFLKPRLELGSDGKNMYGNVGISMTELPLLIDIGRVNWGEISNNPKGLAANLAATRISIQTNTSLAYGSIFARAEHNSISDGNTVLATALRFTPVWRPFGPHFKPFLGVETRDAKQSKAEYWTPVTGYGNAFAGMTAEWQETDWNFITSVQAETRLYGEAGTSWSVSSSGKYWLNKDWAVGFRLWAMESERNLQRYRAKSAFITVEKLWD